MFVEADLTQRQYEIIRNIFGISNNFILSFYPCYELLICKCYPPKNFMKVISTCTERNLPSLIENTVKRLSITEKNRLIYQ